MHKMHKMHKLHLAFLLVAALMTSGFNFRCYFFCEDQTGIQNDYVADRDECRDVAQNKLDEKNANNPTPLGAKESKAQLVALFNECMSVNGWDFPVKVASKTASTAVQAQTANPSSATPAGAEKTADNLPPVSSLSDKNRYSSRPKDAPLMVDAKSGKANVAGEAENVADSLPNPQKPVIKKSFSKNKEDAKSGESSPEKADASVQEVKTEATAEIKQAKQPTPQPTQQPEKKVKNLATKPAEKVGAAKTEQVSSKTLGVKTEETPKQSAPVQSVEQKPIENIAPQKSEMAKDEPVKPTLEKPVEKPQSTSSKRAGECAFARRFASFSASSATKAEACDLECAEQLKTSLKNFVPAACPSDVLKDLGKAK